LACGVGFQQIGLVEIPRWSDAARRKRIALLSIRHNSEFA
jgi:hypothetical protein